MIVLRSALFNLWFYGLTFFLCLWHGVVSRSEAAVDAAARRWTVLVLGGLRRLCGIDWQVEGMESLPAGAALLAPMHQSAFDTLVWVDLLPGCVYVLKQELTRIPIFGTLLLRRGMIAVDRRGGAGALRALLRDAEAAVGKGRKLIIFPEGTRVAPGASVPLQPGVAAIAQRTGLPVIPVVTDSGLYWGRRAFLKRPGRIRIRVLPPLPGGLKRDELLARLAQAYAEGYRALRAGL